MLTVGLVTLVNTTVDAFEVFSVLPPDLVIVSVLVEILAVHVADRSPPTEFKEDPVKVALSGWLQVTNSNGESQSSNLIPFTVPVVPGLKLYE